jgi:hypothetical protein
MVPSPRKFSPSGGLLYSILEHDAGHSMTQLLDILATGTGLFENEKAIWFENCTSGLEARKEE